MHAVATFTRAIRVTRDDFGAYQIVVREEPWGGLDAEATIVEVISELIGWGRWTHVARVDFGICRMLFFVR